MILNIVLSLTLLTGCCLCIAPSLCFGTSNSVSWCFHGMGELDWSSVWPTPLYLTPRNTGILKFLTFCTLQGGKHVWAYILYILFKRQLWYGACWELWQSFIARKRGPTLAKTGGGPRFPSFVQLMSGGSRSLVLLQISGYCEPLRRRCPQWMYWVATYTACLLRTGLQGWGRILPRLEDHVMLLNHICSIYSKDW